MKPLVIFLLLCLLTLRAEGGLYFRCPLHPCLCESGDMGLVMNCRQRFLTRIPPVIASDLTFQEISLKKNNIRRIGKHAFKGIKVKKIDLSENIITGIDDDAFDGVEDILEELVIQLYNMEGLPLKALQKLNELKVLHVIGCKVPVLVNSTFSMIPTLQEIRLISCGINEIETDAFVGIEGTLKVLDLFGNNLKTVPSPALNGLGTVEKMVLTGNKLTNIIENSFHGMTSLRHLELSSNGIYSIDPMAFEGVQTSLEFLGLQRNRLTANDLVALRLLRNLNQLELAYNQIEDIPSRLFRHLNRVTLIGLQSNKIQGINRLTFAGTERKLKVLLLSDNDVNVISPNTFQGFRCLRHLYLDRTNAGSGLSRHSFKGLAGSLETLNMQRSGFTASGFVAISNLGELKTLVLRDNQITSLLPQAFSKLRRLTRLDLQGNKLESITNPETFQGLEKSLRQLVLSNNMISTLSECVFEQFEQLRDIVLNQNPLICDCKLLWLKRWVISKTSTFSRNTLNWICAGPRIHAGKLFRAVQNEEMVCPGGEEKTLCSSLHQNSLSTQSLVTTSIRPPENPTSNYTAASSTSTTTSNIQLKVTTPKDDVGDSKVDINNGPPKMQLLLPNIGDPMFRQNLLYNDIIEKTVQLMAGKIGKPFPRKRPRLRNRHRFRQPLKTLMTTPGLNRKRTLARWLSSTRRMSTKPVWASRRTTSRRESMTTLGERKSTAPVHTNRTNRRMTTKNKPATLSTSVSPVLTTAKPFVASPEGSTSSTDVTQRTKQHVTGGVTRKTEQRVSVYVTRQAEKHLTSGITRRKEQHVMGNITRQTEQRVMGNVTQSGIDNLTRQVQQDITDNVTQQTEQRFTGNVTNQLEQRSNNQKLPTGTTQNPSVIIANSGKSVTSPSVNNKSIEKPTVNLTSAAASGKIRSTLNGLLLNDNKIAVNVLNKEQNAVMEDGRTSSNVLTSNKKNGVTISANSTAFPILTNTRATSFSTILTENTAKNRKYTSQPNTLTDTGWFGKETSELNPLSKDKISTKNQSNNFNNTESLNNVTYRSKLDETADMNLKPTKGPQSQHVTSAVNRSDTVPNTSEIATAYVNHTTSLPTVKTKNINIDTSPPTTIQPIPFNSSDNQLDERQKNLTLKPTSPNTIVTPKNVNFSGETTYKTNTQSKYTSTSPNLSVKMQIQTLNKTWNVSGDYSDHKKSLNPGTVSLHSFQNDSFVEPSSGIIETTKYELTTFVPTSDKLMKKYRTTNSHTAFVETTSIPIPKSMSTEHRTTGESSTRNDGIKSGPLPTEYKPTSLQPGEETHEHSTNINTMQNGTVLQNSTKNKIMQLLSNKLVSMTKEANSSQPLDDKDSIRNGDLFDFMKTTLKDSLVELQNGTIYGTVVKVNTTTQTMKTPILLEASHPKTTEHIKTTGSTHSRVPSLKNTSPSREIKTSRTTKTPYKDSRNPYSKAKEEPKHLYTGRPRTVWGDVAVIKNWLNSALAGEAKEQGNRPSKISIISNSKTSLPNSNEGRIKNPYERLRNSKRTNFGLYLNSTPSGFLRKGIIQGKAELTLHTETTVPTTRTVTKKGHGTIVNNEKDKDKLGNRLNETSGTRSPHDNSFKNQDSPSKEETSYQQGSLSTLPNLKPGPMESNKRDRKTQSENKPSSSTTNTYIASSTRKTLPESSAAIDQIENENTARITNDKLSTLLTASTRASGISQFQTTQSLDIDSTNKSTGYGNHSKQSAELDDILIVSNRSKVDRYTIPDFAIFVNILPYAINAVKVTWNVSHDRAVSGFRVYYGDTENETLVEGPLLGKTVRTHDVTSLLSDSKYTFCVVAYFSNPKERKSGQCKETKINFKEKLDTVTSHEKTKTLALIIGSYAAGALVFVSLLLSIALLVRRYRDKSKTGLYVPRASPYWIEFLCGGIGTSRFSTTVLDSSTATVSSGVEMSENDSHSDSDESGTYSFDYSLRSLPAQHIWSTADLHTNLYTY